MNFLSSAVLVFCVSYFTIIEDASAQHLPHCLFHKEIAAAKGGFLSLRPHADASLASTEFPLTVHWPVAVTEEYAKEILGYAEASWRKQFVEMGFTLPHTDGMLGGSSNLDIYLTTDLDPGIGGYAGFSGFNEETPRQDAYGYLVINNNIDPRIRRFVVAHEMFHLSQIAYDWWEDLSFMEASATWIVDHVFPDENIYWRYFPFFNAEPYTTLDYISIKNPYQYGAALFTTFLDEKYGRGDGQFIRKIWEGSIQNDIDNEPDFLDSLEAELGAGVTLEDAYAEFGIWRLLTGSRSASGYFREGALWDQRVDPWMEYSAKISAIAEDSLPLNPIQKAVGPFAHAFLRIENDLQAAATVAGSIKTEDGVLRISHLVVSTSGVRKRHLGTIANGSTINFNLGFTGDDQEHFLIVTNITDGTYDADTSPWTGSSFSFGFTKN
jgi:hypothetical protein